MSTLPRSTTASLTFSDLRTNLTNWISGTGSKADHHDENPPSLTTMWSKIKLHLLDSPAAQDVDNSKSCLSFLANRNDMSVIPSSIILLRILQLQSRRAGLHRPSNIVRSSQTPPTTPTRCDCHRCMDEDEGSAEYENQSWAFIYPTMVPVEQQTSSTDDENDLIGLSPNTQRARLSMWEIEDRKDRGSPLPKRR